MTMNSWMNTIMWFFWEQSGFKGEDRTYICMIDGWFI